MTDTNEIRQAIARAWCNPLNASKEMDADLAEAAVAEVMTVLNSTPQPADAALADEAIYQWRNAGTVAWTDTDSSGYDVALADGSRECRIVYGSAARLRALSQPASERVQKAVDILERGKVEHAVAIARRFEFKPFTEEDAQSAKGGGG